MFFRLWFSFLVNGVAYLHTHFPRLHVRTMYKLLEVHESLKSKLSPQQRVARREETEANCGWEFGGLLVSMSLKVRRVASDDS